MSNTRHLTFSMFVFVGLAAAAVHWLAGSVQLLALAGILGLAVVASRRLSKPLLELATDAEALASGSVREVTTAGSSELYKTRTALNELARVRGEHSRSERERMDLRALMDRMEEGVLALEPGGVIRVANRAAREILGLPVDGSLATSEVPRRELRSVLEASLKTSIRSRPVHVDERVVVVEANLLEGGHAIVSLRDVTDVRRLEEVRTDFVANASHELKTPLTAVRGFAETLLDDETTPEIRKQFLGLIHDNTLRLQAIVEDLLDLSRLESGGWAPTLEPIEVADAAQQAWAEVTEMRDAVRSFRVDGQGVVIADDHGLMHVLRNLLDNALRHTEEDGTIVVDVAPASQGTVTVTIQDDGAGIPPDALPRIFERFFRVDRARSRAQGGTGLGLAIVSHLTSRMGGSVDAESQFGVGTKIHVRLPAA